MNYYNRKAAEHISTVQSELAALLAEGIDNHIPEALDRRIAALVNARTLMAMGRMEDVLKGVRDE